MRRITKEEDDDMAVVVSWILRLMKRVLNILSLAEEEHNNTVQYIQKFLNNEARRSIFFCRNDQSSPSVLTTTFKMIDSSHQLQLDRHPAIVQYFYCVKRADSPVTVDNYRHEVLHGSMMGFKGVQCEKYDDGGGVGNTVFEDVCSEIRDIFSPLLCQIDLDSKAGHQQQQPLLQSLCDFTIQAESSSSTVKKNDGAQYCCNLLSIPTQLTRILSDITDSKASIVELYVNSWIEKVNQAINNLPPDLEYTKPLDEVEWWVTRSQVMNSLFDQLQSERSRAVLVVLDQMKSSLSSKFAMSCKAMFHARTEANENSKVLRLLKPFFDNFARESIYVELPFHFRPLCHLLLLTWKLSCYYNTREALVRILNAFFNQLIAILLPSIVELYPDFSDGGNFLSKDYIPSLEKLKKSIAIVGKCKSAFIYYKRRSFEECPGNAWDVDNDLVFHKIDRLLNFCHSMVIIFQIVIRMKSVRDFSETGLSEETENSMNSICDSFLFALSKIPSIESGLIINLCKTDSIVRDITLFVSDLSIKSVTWNGWISTVLTRELAGKNLLQFSYLSTSYSCIVTDFLQASDIEKLGVIIEAKFELELHGLDLLVQELCRDEIVGYKPFEILLKVGKCNMIQSRLVLIKRIFDSISSAGLLFTSDFVKLCNKIFIDSTESLDRFEPKMMSKWEDAIISHDKRIFNLKEEDLCIFHVVQKMPGHSVPQTVSVNSNNILTSYITKLWALRYSISRVPVQIDMYIHSYRIYINVWRKAVLLSTAINQLIGSLVPTEIGVLPSFIGVVDELYKLSYKEATSSSQISLSHNLSETFRLRKSDLFRNLLNCKALLHETKTKLIGKTLLSSLSLGEELYEEIPFTLRRSEKKIRTTVTSIKKSLNHFNTNVHQDTNAYMEYIQAQFVGELELLITALLEHICYALENTNWTVEAIVVDNNSISRITSFELNVLGLKKSKGLSSPSSLRSVIFKWLKSILHLAYSCSRIDGGCTSYLYEIFHTPKLRKIISSVMRKLKNIEKVYFKICKNFEKLGEGILVNGLCPLLNMTKQSICGVGSKCSMPIGLERSSLIDPLILHYLCCQKELDTNIDDFITSNTTIGKKTTLELDVRPVKRKAHILINQRLSKTMAFIQWHFVGILSTLKSSMEKENIDFESHLGQIISSTLSDIVQLSKHKQCIIPIPLTTTSCHNLLNVMDAIRHRRDEHKKYEKYKTFVKYFLALWNGFIICKQKQKEKDVLTR